MSLHYFKLYDTLLENYNVGLAYFVENASRCCAVCAEIFSGFGCFPWIDLASRCSNSF